MKEAARNWRKKQKIYQRNSKKMIEGKKVIYTGVLLGVLAIILAVISLYRPVPEKVVETIVEKQFGSVSSPIVNSPYFSVNGVLADYISGDCKNATTTLFSLNPYWGIASSTVEYFKLDLSNIGASTTDMVLSVATSSTATSTTLTTGPYESVWREHTEGYARAKSLAGTATTTVGLLNGIDVSATTTLFAGLTASAGAAGSMAPDANSKARLFVGKYEKVIGWVEPKGSTDTTGEAVGTNNTFACSYDIIFRK